jgi:hypothetical protein
MPKRGAESRSRTGSNYTATGLLARRGSERTRINGAVAL